jgi:DNA-directed RNA polymerase subunit RPC12/RpoP
MAMEYLNRNHFNNSPASSSGSLSDITKMLAVPSTSSPPKASDVSRPPRPQSNEAHSVELKTEIDDSLPPPRPQSIGAFPNPPSNASDGSQGFGYAAASPHPPLPASNVSCLPPQSNVPQGVGYEALPLAPQLPPIDPSRGVGPIKGRGSSRGARKLLPYVTCPTCGKDVKNLRQHMKSHEQRKYHCSICPKSFGHPQNLTQHLRVHRDEEPFECKDCGRRFNDAANCKRHQKWHDEKKKEEERALAHPQPPNEKEVRKELFLMLKHSCRYCGIAYVLHSEKLKHEEQRCPDRPGAKHATKEVKRKKRNVPRVAVAKVPCPSPSPIDLTTTSSHWHQPVSSAPQQSAQTTQAAATTSPAPTNVRMSVLLVTKSPREEPVSDRVPSQTPRSHRCFPPPANPPMQTPETQQFMAHGRGSCTSTAYSFPDTSRQSGQVMADGSIPLYHLAQAVTPQAPPPCPPPYPTAMVERQRWRLSQAQHQRQEQPQYDPCLHSMMAMNDSGYNSTEVSPMVGNPRRSSFY